MSWCVSSRINSAVSNISPSLKSFSANGVGLDVEILSELCSVSKISKRLSASLWQKYRKHGDQCK